MENNNRRPTRRRISDSPVIEKNNMIRRRVKPSKELSLPSSRTEIGRAKARKNKISSIKKAGSVIDGRKKKLLRIVSRVAAGILCAIVIFLLAFWAIRVRSIYVSGLVNKNSSDVVALSGINDGDSILFLPKKDIKENIEQDPHFIYKGIGYNFPTGITINIYERIEAGAIEFANTYVLIDANGLILGHINKADGTKLPVIKGMKVSEFVLGQNISVEDEYQLTVLSDFLNVLSTKKITPAILDADFSEVNQIILHLSNDITVKMGQISDVKEKLSWIEEMYNTVIEKGYRGGTIDVSSLNTPVYIPEEEPIYNNSSTKENVVQVNITNE